MDHSNSPHPDAAKLRELSKALQSMRDSLVNVSLSLHDLKFHLDTEGREQVELQTQTVLKNLRV